MRNSLITVKVKIEGLSEGKEFELSMPEDSKLKQLFPEIISKHGEYLKPYFYNTMTNNLGIFATIINNKLVIIRENLDYKLKDGDELFFLSPLGGG